MSWDQNSGRHSWEMGKSLRRECNFEEVCFELGIEFFMNFSGFYCLTIMKILCIANNEFHRDEDNNKY